MKKIILIFLILVPILAFSQVDSTKTKYTVPKVVAKEVVKDLISGDSAKAILVITNQQLKKTEDLVTERDSSVHLLENKVTDYKTQVKLDSAATKIYVAENKNLAKEVKQLKAKKTFNNILHYVIMGGLVYLYATK